MANSELILQNRLKEGYVLIYTNDKVHHLKPPNFGDLVIKFNNGKPHLVETRETEKI